MAVHTYMFTKGMYVISIENHNAVYISPLNAQYIMYKSCVKLSRDTGISVIYNISIFLNYCWFLSGTIINMSSVSGLRPVRQHWSVKIF